MDFKGQKSQLLGGRQSEGGISRNNWIVILIGHMNFHFYYCLVVFLRDFNYFPRCGERVTGKGTRLEPHAEAGYWYHTEPVSQNP